MGPQSAVDREFVYIDLFSLFSLSLIPHFPLFSRSARSTRGSLVECQLCMMSLLPSRRKFTMRRPETHAKMISNNEI